MNHETLSREITATPAEFRRGIVAAFPDAQATADGWQIEWSGASAEIRLGALPDLSIGLLRLTRQTCDITLRGGTAEARAALLDRLDRYQQRGGG
jgi:hypothetical protein